MTGSESLAPEDTYNQVKNNPEIQKNNKNKACTCKLMEKEMGLVPWLFLHPGVDRRELEKKKKQLIVWSTG